MAVNVYQMVTDRIIAELSKGNIPWHKPWTGTTDGAFNRISKKPYSLLNQMLLKHSGEYASFKQWSDLGGKIKKGEKSEMVVFWKIMKKVVKSNGSGKTKVKTIPVLRYFNVFHISQVEGVEPLEEPFKDREIKTADNADDVIDDYLKRSGVYFYEEKSNKAFYSPMLDKVVVPMKNQFENTNEWYGTAFHELTHSTGHKSRLNRFTNGQSAAFGSETYSKEELVAEMGSAFILNMLGIETHDTFQNSTAYIQSWISVLKNDTRMVVSAASKAEKATNLILGVEG